MELTEENKAQIDALDYESLLYHWRFSPAGDSWMEGETGKYWGQRMEVKLNMYCYQCEQCNKKWYSAAELEYMFTGTCSDCGGELLISDAGELLTQETNKTNCS